MRFYWRLHIVRGSVGICSEGARGALAAWRLTNGTRPSWLEFARRYGDFLVARQAPDGSIKGEWSWNGNPLSNFTNVADVPIPLLAELYLATGAEKYRIAALAAGRFSAGQMNPSFLYVGGACDNPNVLDKVFQQTLSSVPFEWRDASHPLALLQASHTRTLPFTIHRR